MKKRITIDELAMCFASAVAYGIGYLIPEYFGLPGIVCFIICFIPGLLVEELLEIIIFCRYIQEKIHRRVIAWGACVVVFVVGTYVSQRIFGIGLFSDLEEEFIWAFGLPIISFIISLISYSVKKHRLLKKYGDGSKGYILTKVERAYMYGLNGQNKQIIGKYNEKLSVKTVTGTYVGKKKRNTVAYLGIPYAKAPVGELRWKKPVPLSPSDDVFEALYYGASAIQPDNEANPIHYHRQSEDCLYLNIWTTKGKNKPVLVYLHDGNFISGGSVDPIGEGEEFVKKHPETVFVSLNYRLGLFGFVDFSRVNGGEDYPDSVNCGLLDQIEALKWIKQNIGSFGGDPDNITLMGAGCGGACAMLLSAIEQSRNLFRKIILVSASTEYIYDDTKSSQELGSELVKHFGVKGMSELSALPADELKKIMMQYANIGCAPSCQTTLLPENIFTCYEDGLVRDDLDLLIVLPKNEISNTVALFGRDAAETMIQNWYDQLGETETHSLWKAVCDMYQINKNCKNTDVLFDNVGNLVFIDLPLYLGRKLSEQGHKVHFLFWNAKPDIEKFKSNATYFLTTVLHNFDVGEVFGYINDKTVCDVMGIFISQFLSDKKLAVYANEIKGMKAIDWQSYLPEKPSVLCVNHKKLKIDTAFHEEQMERLEKIIEE